jgi:CRISPR/Cas system-associated exonuclease Cas4 (RecB family)
MKKIKISNSSYDTYQQCPQKYYLKHIEFVKPFTDVRYPLVTGVAFHSLVNKMYETENFSRDFLIKNWKPCFIEALENEACAFASTKGYEAQLQKGYILVQKFYKFADSEGYLVKPIKTEWPFKIEYSTFTISGIIDLIIKRNDTVEVIDFKTGWTMPTQLQVDEHQQLTLYHWAVKDQYNFESVTVGLFFPRQAKILRSERNADQHKALLTKITDTVTKIQEGNFDPEFSHCKDCEFQKHCSHFKG